MNIFEIFSKAKSFLPSKSGPSYMFITFLIRVFALCRLDDPLDAVAVHGGGGVIGVLMQPFFAYGNDDDNNPLGIFWGASGLVTRSNFGAFFVGF